MNTSDLRLLQVLAEERNMRKAAERLFVSQPALSQRLKNLEQQWNAQFFLRSARGVTVTPAGEKVIAYAIDTLNNEEMVRDELRTLNDKVHGTLKLAVASILGQYWLPVLLKRFVEQFPKVRISLTTGWSSEMMKQLYNDEIHLGFVRGNRNPDWSGRTIHLMTDHFYLVDRDIQSFDELESTDKPFILFKSDSTYYQEIHDWWHHHYNASPERTIVVDQIETCKQLALQGIGYAILPSIALTKGDEAFYKIPLKKKDGSPLTRDTWLIGSEASFGLSQVQAFVAIVDELNGRVRT
ncbi:LysR family transcriptional regulator [Aureibacillus halotolerans]|uniref:DNA-binding transcriptional LysR family regulator n=1 Tax=Aureibacillus halotolerans TaxID=1508390 RepID=A0A4R6U8W1_9BACI|nr:LysR family transcriptional regulator [Aureibacillus halotolerans]TDQ42246.1 DNA-binding transcriptional LysR family regulator [Aureibacillus halotolerans]